ncbi:MAG: hypothetical protein NTV40_00070 [Solirubrobacterales bacterium]|nr:hypothetical protein [Solirubrobacterales bacterium]
MEEIEPAAPAEVQEALRDVMELARGLAVSRLEELDDPAAEITPFGVVRTESGLVPVLLDEVAEQLGNPDGMGRVAASLLGRYEADAFAIAARWYSSPDGSPDHPQAREVMRVIVGHSDGLSGAIFAEIDRRPEGPRLSAVWEAVA